MSGVRLLDPSQAKREIMKELGLDQRNEMRLEIQQSGVSKSSTGVENVVQLLYKLEAVKVGFQSADKASSAVEIHRVGNRKVVLHGLPSLKPGDFEVLERIRRKGWAITVVPNFWDEKKATLTVVIRRAEK